MSLENTLIYILVTNMVLGLGIIKKCLEQRENYKDVGKEQRNRISSHRSYLIENKDLVVKDYSDVNEDWKKSQSVERLLLEENEDKDVKEFSYNCKQYKFERQKTPKTPKKSKEPPKKNLKWDTCDCTSGIKYSLKRHIERYKHK